MTLLQSDSPVTSKDIASYLNISARAVHHSLRGVNYWLKQKGIIVDKKSGFRLSIDVSEKIKRQLVSELKEMNGYLLILSPIERQRFLILSLLTEEESISSKLVARTLGVSRPTSLNDFNIVEQWLLNYEIKLIRRSGVGFSVEGLEINFRNAIENVLIETIGEISLLALYQGKHNSILSKIDKGKPVLSPIPLTLDSLNLSFCSSLVERIEKLSNYNFSDSSHISMALFFSIIISRNKSNRIIEHYAKFTRKFKSTKEYEIANIIARRINDQYDLNMSKNEIVNIAVRIMGTKSRQSLLVGDINTNTILTDSEMKKIIFEMISEASKLLHPILSIDQKLFKGLMVHLIPAINRLTFNLPIRNFLLDEIREQYPYIFMVSEKCAAILESKLDCQIPEEEIGYLAMHLGAAMERLRTFSSYKRKTLIVCGGGCATAWMLISRVQAEFPEIEVVEVSSMLEITQKKLNAIGVDFIITTVPIENTDIPTVLVNPLLNDTDKDQIRKILITSNKQLNHKGKFNHELGFSIQTLLSEENIQTRIKANSWQNAVNITCQPLIKNGAIEKKYQTAIKRLLIKHGPYMVLSREVVLLHAMIGHGVNQLCMGLTTFSPSVKFGHKSNDPVSVAIVFGTVNSHSHLKALSQISKLLGENAFIQSLKIQKSSKDVLSLIDKTLQNIV